MKRCGNFENNIHKKAKVDDLEDLWGEDPDIDDIDNCLLLASQACQKKDFNTKLHNVSILPSYSFFKDDEKIRFSSTQTNSLNATINKASTSTFKVPTTKNKPLSNNESIYELENKLSKLQSQYEAKEGEVTILRTQLRSTKDSLDTELYRKQQEFTDQMNKLKKEKGIFAADLEFKQLEIANLKRTLLDVSKSAAETSFNATQIIKNTRTIKNNDNPTNEFHIVLNEEFPLKASISSNIFYASSKDRCQFNSNYLFKNIAPYLQNEMTEKLIKLRPKETLINDEVLKINYIFPDISKFINCNLKDINNKENHVNINKIISVSFQFLHNLHKYLKNIGDCTQKETLRQLDVEYLNNICSVYKNKCLFDPIQWTEEEEGIHCRQTIAVICEILPYNDYLKSFLTENVCLNISQDEEYIKNLDPFIYRGNNDYDFLKLLLNLITVIGRYRKSNNYIGLLCAVSRLLSKICQCIDSKSVNSSILFSLITNIFRQIVFSRPTNLVFYYLSDFLKNASLHYDFVQKLCNLESKFILKQNAKKKITLINKDCCTSQIFTLLTRDNLKNEELTLQKYEKHFNILKFVSNVFKCKAPWLNFQENTHFACLFELVILSIEIIYGALETFNTRSSFNENDEIIIVCKNILRSSIQILNILNFKYDTLLDIDTEICSKYKYIKSYLLEMKNILDLREYDVEVLEKLSRNNPEESQLINIDKLSKLQLWVDSD